MRKLGRSLEAADWLRLSVAALLRSQSGGPTVEGYLIDAGLGCCRVRSYGLARRYLAKAIELGSTACIAGFYLGKCCWELKDLRGFLRAVLFVQRRDPESAYLRRLAALTKSQRSRALSAFITGTLMPKRVEPSRLQ